MEEMAALPLQEDTNVFCSAVIVAAGKSRRMEANVNKVYMDLHGKKTIVRTLEAFQQSPVINEIILVVDSSDVKYCELEVVNQSSFTKLRKIAEGGPRRQDSVCNGLREISNESELVLIHDGARPLVTQEIILRSVYGALEYGAVTTGVPVKDTIKMVGPNGFVSDTLDRSTLWAVQTPQVFRKSIITEAHKKADQLGIEATDDAMLAEKLGYKLKIIEGSYENIKLTTPEDVTVARAIIREREEMGI